MAQEAGPSSFTAAISSHAATLPAAGVPAVPAGAGATGLPSAPAQPAQQPGIQPQGVALQPVPLSQVQQPRLTTAPPGAPFPGPPGMPRAPVAYSYHPRPMAPRKNPAAASLAKLTGRKSCNCKNSRCLKLYCECFASGRYCDACNCQNCFNNRANETVRQAAVEAVLERNPNAFRPKIQNSEGLVMTEAGAQSVLITGDAQGVRHTKGCCCKKSSCLKKYCECFQAGIFCSEVCKCVDCKNFEGSTARAQVLTHIAPGSHQSHRAQIAAQQAAAIKAVSLQQRMAAAQAAAIPMAAPGPTGSVAMMQQGLMPASAQQLASSMQLAALQAAHAQQQTQHHQQQALQAAPPQQNSQQAQPQGQQQLQQAYPQLQLQPSAPPQEQQQAVSAAPLLGAVLPAATAASGVLPTVAPVPFLQPNPAMTSVGGAGAALAPLSGAPPAQPHPLIEAIAEVVKPGVVDELCKLLVLVAHEEAERHQQVGPPSSSGAGSIQEPLTVESEAPVPAVRVEPNQQQLEPQLHQQPEPPPPPDMLVDRAAAPPAGASGAGDGATQPQPDGDGLGPGDLYTAQEAVVLAEFSSILRKIVDAAAKKASSLATGAPSAAVPASAPPPASVPAPAPMLAPVPAAAGGMLQPTGLVLPPGLAALLRQQGTVSLAQLGLAPMPAGAPRTTMLVLGPGNTLVPAHSAAAAGVVVPGLLAQQGGGLQQLLHQLPGHPVQVRAMLPPGSQQQQQQQQQQHLQQLQVMHPSQPQPVLLATQQPVALSQVQGMPWAARLPGHAATIAPAAAFGSPSLPNGIQMLPTSAGAPSSTAALAVPTTAAAPLQEGMAPTDSLHLMACSPQEDGDSSLAGTNSALAVAAAAAIAGALAAGNTAPQDPPNTASDAAAAVTVAALTPNAACDMEVT